MALEVVQDSTEDSLINSIRSPIRLGANTLEKVTIVTLESFPGLGCEPGIFFCFSAISLRYSAKPQWLPYICINRCNI
jgi:hypothetical protein